MPAVNYNLGFEEVALYKRIKMILQQDGQFMDFTMNSLSPEQVAVIHATVVHKSLVLRVYKVPAFSERYLKENVGAEPDPPYFFKLAMTKSLQPDRSLLAIEDPRTDANSMLYQKYQIVLVRDCLELEPELL